MNNHAMGVGKRCVIAAASICMIVALAIVPSIADQLGEYIDRYHRLATSKSVQEDTEYGSREALELHRACAFSKYEVACSKQIDISGSKTFARTPWAVAVAHHVRGQIRERRGNLSGALEDYIEAQGRHNFRNLDQRIARLKAALMPARNNRQSALDKPDLQPHPSPAEPAAGPGAKTPLVSAQPPAAAHRGAPPDPEFIPDAEAELAGHPLRLRERVGAAAAAPFTAEPLAKNGAEHAEAPEKPVHHSPAPDNARQPLSSIETISTTTKTNARAESSNLVTGGTRRDGKSWLVINWPVFILLLASILSIALLLVAGTSVGTQNDRLAVLRSRMSALPLMATVPSSDPAPALPSAVLEPAVLTPYMDDETASMIDANDPEPHQHPDQQEKDEVLEEMHAPRALAPIDGIEQDDNEGDAQNATAQHQNNAVVEAAEPDYSASQGCSSTQPLDQAFAKMITEVLRTQASMLIVHGRPNLTQHLANLVRLAGGGNDREQLKIVLANQLSLSDFLELFCSDLSHLKDLEFENTLNALFDLQCYACEPFLGEDFIRHHRSTLRHIFRLLQEIPSANIETLLGLLQQTDSLEIRSVQNRLRTPSTRDFFATRYHGTEFKKFAQEFSRKLEILDDGREPLEISHGINDAVNSISSLGLGQFLILDFENTKLSARRETSIRAKIAQFAMPYLSTSGPNPPQAPTFVLIDNEDRWFNPAERSQNMIIGYLIHGRSHVTVSGLALDDMFTGLSPVSLDGIGKVGKFYEHTPH